MELGALQVTASEDSEGAVDAATLKEAGVVRFAGGKGSVQGLVNNVEEMDANLRSPLHETTVGTRSKDRRDDSERALVTTWLSDSCRMQLTACTSIQDVLVFLCSYVAS